jgi:hypothetical protein
MRKNLLRRQGQITSQATNRRAVTDTAAICALGLKYPKSGNLGTIRMEAEGTSVSSSLLYESPSQNSVKRGICTTTQADSTKRM